MLGCAGSSCIATNSSCRAMYSSGDTSLTATNSPATSHSNTCSAESGRHVYWITGDCTEKQAAYRQGTIRVHVQDVSGQQGCALCQSSRSQVSAEGLRRCIPQSVSYIPQEGQLVVLVLVHLYSQPPE